MNEDITVEECIKLTAKKLEYMHEFEEFIKDNCDLSQLDDA